MQTQKIIENLETVRRLSWPGFEKIVLEPEAVKILVNLFLHPGCKSDINLAKFLTGQSVSLTDISPHIITAFPSQVAAYASAHGLKKITGPDLLECFALDHADAVEESQDALQFEPSYALAHVLTVGKVVTTRSVANRQIADIKVKVCQQDVNFTNVLVPTAMLVKTDTMVFHHFGVIVAVASNKKMKSLAVNLQTKQDQKRFMQRVIKQVMGQNKQEINYARIAIFKTDMTGKIIEQANKDFDFSRLWQEEDLKKIKIPKEARVMFQS
ncbi:hypothetical protein KKC06_06165 [Patescibacteria group bacterium]|nr:hypothetical protein [Patescibacteria group bacterium]